MTVDSFRDYVLDQLAALRGLRCVAMFGGYGIYRGDDFFAILHRGRLYFRTDDISSERYIEHGMQPFRPKPRMTLKTYYEVPVEVIDDTNELVEWARVALASRPRRAKPNAGAPRKKKK